MKQKIEDIFQFRLDTCTTHTNNVTNNYVGFLPYARAITDQLDRLLLPVPKDELNSLLAKGIYRIHCSCSSVYVGETIIPSMYLLPGVRDPRQLTTAPCLPQEFKRILITILSLFVELRFNLDSCLFL